MDKKKDETANIQKSEPTAPREYDVTDRKKDVGKNPFSLYSSIL